MGVFYAHSVMIGSRDSEWLQGDINFLIGLFRRVRRMANVSKYKTTTFQPVAIHTGISEEAFRRRIKGKGGTYQENMRRIIPCPDCGVELAARSMTGHHRRLHGTEPDIDGDKLPFIQTEHLPLMYEFSFLTNIQSCQCPFPGCPGMPWSRSGLQTF